MRWKRFFSSCALCGAGFVLAMLVMPTSSGAADKKPPVCTSSVVKWDAAAGRHTGDWGEMRAYFTGQTFGTKDAFVARAVIKPGKAVHRAHRHVEEEYLVVTEGSGVWSLDGKDIPAERGDILYVEPWIYHGLTNTGDKPLTFIVVKFNAKNVPLPPRPDQRKDEL